MKEVVKELEEQLSYAQMDEVGEEEYAEQLEKAIDILSNYQEGDSKMYELTLEALLRVGNSYFARHEADYMLTWITGATPHPELIINPKENFDNKLTYFKRAYDEDLSLKANPDIKISRYAFVTEEELSEHLHV